jgi:hypothetical protein
LQANPLVPRLNKQIVTDSRKELEAKKMAFKIGAETVQNEGNLKRQRGSQGCG